MDKEELKKLIKDFANDYNSNEKQEALYDALHYKFDRGFINKLYGIFNDPKPWVCSIATSISANFITGDQIISAIIGVPIGFGMSSLYNKIREAAVDQKADFIKLLNVRIDLADEFNAEEATDFVDSLEKTVPNFGLFEILKEGLSQPNPYPGVDLKYIT